jgi:DNA polymerase I-like protein with 3'-5' exonuclease and polymerase domains
VSSRAPDRARDAADVAALARRIRTERPAAVGLWVEPDGPRPAHLQDDPRVGVAATVGVALAEDGRDTHVLDASVDPFEDLLEALVEADGPYLVFHDAHAALARLGARTGRPFEPTRVGCTEIAAILLAEGTRPGRDRPSLEQLTDKILGRELAQTALAAVPSAAVVAARADALLPLMHTLMPMLRKRALVGVYRLETEVLAATIAMERAGFGVDAARFQQLADAWQAERATTTDPERIARLDKLVSTYGYWPREYVRGGRIHPRLHPLAADSGRFSCTDPNLQQVPSEHTAPGLRGCFEAPPGHRLVVADYAQIELRIAAHLAPCDALRSVFLDGRDPHRTTAATITGKPEDEISDRERKLAKAVNFGFLFGMGAARFRRYAADSYGVDVDETAAAEARAAFGRTYPGIDAWHRRVGALGRVHRAVTVRTALGRRKRFEAGRFSYNAALNIPVQGTAAEGFKRAMIELHPALRAIGGRGVLCVHDEYIAEVPEARAEEGRELVASIMRRAMASIVDTVPIEVDAVVSGSWAGDR